MTIGLTVICTPRAGHFYVLASQLYDVPPKGTWNVYPKVICRADCAVPMSVPANSDTRYIEGFELPDSFQAAVQAMINGGGYWYMEGSKGTVPAELVSISDRVASTR